MKLLPALATRSEVMVVTPPPSSRSQQAPVGRDVPAVLPRPGPVQLRRRDGQTVGPEDGSLAAGRGGAAEPRLRSGSERPRPRRDVISARSRSTSRPSPDSPQAASSGESERPTRGWFVLPAAGTEQRRLNYWCWTLTWTTWRKTPTE